MKKILSTLFVALITIGAVNAQNANDIASKYVKAIGGVKAWKSVKSRKATISMNMQGMDFPGFILGDNQNRERVELNFQGMKIIQAYDGETAWALSPPQGITTPTALPEDQAKAMKESTFLDDLIDYKKNGTKISYEGEEEMDGKACYKLKTVLKTGKEELLYIDKSSYLKIASSTVANGQTLVSHFSDFKTQDGVTVPTKIEVKSGGQTIQSVTITKIENNVEIKDEMFAFKG